MPGKHHLRGFKIAPKKIGSPLRGSSHRRWVKPPPPPLGKKLDPPLGEAQLVQLLNSFYSWRYPVFATGRKRAIHRRIAILRKPRDPRDHRIIAIRGFAPSLGLPRTGNIAPRKKRDGTQTRAQQAPPPPQIGSTMFFIYFFLRMLKNKAEIARESIKTTLELPRPLSGPCRPGPLPGKFIVRFRACNVRAGT